jgi:hypothetical protein
MKLRVSIIAAIAAFASVPANAAVIGDFRLDGSLTNVAGGALTLSNNGGALGASGIAFGAGHGPSITGFASTGVYSVEVAFSLSTLSGWTRLLEFKGLTADTGLYSYAQRAYFYNSTISPQGDLMPDTMARLVFTRDGAGNSVAYIGNDAVISFNDAGNLATITSVLNFFNDDIVLGGEQSAGFVDYIRIYDTALSLEQVTLLAPPAVNGAVPEPTTWALMLAGFGLAGSAMRRRRRVSATA